MFTEAIWIKFTPEQAARLRAIAQRQGRTIDAVVRDAVDSIDDVSDARRHRAAMAILEMGTPVDDWDVMKRQIEESRYPELDGWRPRE